MQVIGELCYGARKSSRVTANLARIENFAESVVVLPCDTAIARRYGRLKDELRVKRAPDSRQRRLDCGHCATIRLAIGNPR
jgi:predicted nucleic acid-binding protein